MVRHIWIPYCGTAPAPEDLLQRWNLDPVLLAVLAVLAGACYWMRFRSGEAPGRRWPIPCLALLGILLFVSPICALASALFSVRELHHLILATLMAPLAAAAFRPPAPPGIHVISAVPVLHAAAFWLWHVPAFYEAALSSDAAYWAMQFTLFSTAFLLWRVVAGASPLLGALCLVLTMTQMGMLGAILTFAAQPLYAPHFFTTEMWGLSALQDQQIAGALMWVGGSGIYAAAALYLLAKTLNPKAAAPSC